MEFTSASRSLAHKLDCEDGLRHFRDRFQISDPNLIYLDGNSLGRLPKETSRHLKDAIDQQWGKQLIRGWNENWFDKPAEIGAQLAQLMGANPEEVIVCDTTSINLFKLATAALQARPERKTILSDVFNFPSDLYILQGITDLLGGSHHLDLLPSQDSITIPGDQLRENITDDVALVTLSHVSFKSAFMYDMEEVTQLAHRAGALVLWDISHSAGAVPLHLHEWGVDLAVGCTYKYLNGGPGAPAFLYVRRDLQESLSSPIWGWFGVDAPFDFNLEYTPAQGITRFQVSTPHVLSLLAVEPALEILLEAGIENLRQKSVRQTEYLLHLARETLLPLGYRIGSPLDPEKRGSHVTLRHPEAYRICQALIDPHRKEDGPQVIPDFREPDNIRLGIAPLYTSFTDIHRALGRMAEIIQHKSYKSYPMGRSTVT